MQFIDHQKLAAQLNYSNMEALITGINGFIGTYLAKHLIETGFNVSGTSRQEIKNKDYKVYNCDLLDYESSSQVIKSSRPDYIFHLAAQSNIPYSFSHPQETMETNVNGTLNLLEIVRQKRRKTIFLSVGSSAEYGRTAIKNHFLFEDAPLLPTSPFGVSKMTQGQLCQIYREAYQLNIIHVRPFAIIGPGKKGDAISDFCRGIVAIEKGEKTFLSVGNLSHARDFLDVRDTIRAMDIISSKENRYPIYNLCSGVETKLENILDMLISMAKTKVIMRKDPLKTRPADDPLIVGNPERLFSLGFRPKYKIEQTLKDVLNYWRNEI